MSSSVRNFEEKLKVRTGLQKYRTRDLFKKTLFIGLYHEIDYLRFIVHRGQKVVFWCGSDVLAITRRSGWIKAIRRTSARHVCENEIEQRVLRKLGIRANIHPMIFSDPDIPIAFDRRKDPNVYLTAHPGREQEYGVNVIEYLAPSFPGITFHIYGVRGRERKNVKYHGQVTEKRFNEDIKEYQAAIRLNKFDGFADTLAKSALMGQYPMSMIPYPHITHVPDASTLVRSLDALSKKKKPNIETRMYWKRTLNQSLHELTK